MGVYLLRLAQRQKVVRCATAVDAYRWLDDHADVGEEYELAWLEDKVVLEILRDVHQPGGRHHAAR